MTEKQQILSQEERTLWKAQVAELLGDIEQWARDQQWSVKREDKEIDEKDLGTYETSVLTIQFSQGRLIVEPVARSVVGADGRVDLYAWPSLNRVRLLRIADKWTVRTDSGLDWPNSWGRNTFVQLATDLARAS